MTGQLTPPKICPLVRSWAITSIRHRLFVGHRARVIAQDCEDHGHAVIGTLPERLVTFSMQDITGTGPTMDAALRHWCEQAEDAT